MALSALAAVAMLLARAWWVFELATHFSLQVAAFAGVAGLVLGVRRRWRMASVALAVVAVVLLRLAADHAWTPGPKRATGPRTLRVVSLNVYIHSRSYEKVSRFLRESDADVIGLVEVNERWAQQLAPLAVEWPNVVSEPRESSFGMMLLSRLPIESHEVLDLGGEGRVTIRAVVRAPDGPVTVILFHPPPPSGPRRARLRDVEMERLQGEALGQARLVVIGDFNCTPYSPRFQYLVHESYMHDTRRGFGIQATWPSPLVPLMIPIDHALVSDGLAVVDRRVGPGVGSDHRPIVVDLAPGPR